MRYARRFMGVALAGALTMSLTLAGCGSSKSAKTDPASTGDEAQGTIKMINGKGEVADAMEALASAYNGQTDGAKIEIETVSPGVDVAAEVKGYYLADEMPDIIACEAGNFASWEGLLADMSDQPWVSDTDAAYVDEEFGTIGFPYTTEAIGFAYNADILKKAGIDPKKLTGPAAYEEAFASLDAQKGSLGLDAVVGWCAEDKELWWSSGNHIFGVYLDEGLDREDTTYIDMVNNDQKLDKKRAKNYADFVGMMNQYSDPGLLVGGTYDQQVAGFASGKYAFVTQGSWIGSLLTGANKDDYKAGGNFKVGMAPYAFEDGQETILTSPPSWWAVPKEGNVEEAEKFLVWCASDAGQKILVEQAGFVSPFKSCSYVAEDPFAPVLAQYIADGKTSNWHWQQMNTNCPQAFGPVYNQYARGSLDADGFVAGLQAVIKDVYSK